MTFATSYYANIQKIKKQYPDYILVSISGDIPDYVKDEVHKWDKRLAPNLSLFQEYKASPEGSLREKKYVQRFKDEVLIKYDINEIFKEWTEKCGLNEKYVMLCYESNNINDSTFCHRRIVAEAIEQKYGIKVPELGFDYENYKIEDYKVKLKAEINEDEW